VDGQRDPERPQRLEVRDQRGLGLGRVLPRMHAQQHGRRTLGRWNLARHGLGSEYPAQEVEGSPPAARDRA
jgi:hypothetical protein